MEQQWEEFWKAPMVMLYHKGKLGKIVLNRPETHNAFNPQLIQELQQAFQKFEENPQIRVVLLTGSGKSFCAGADLNWMKQMNQYSMEENIQDALKMAQLFRKIQMFPKPLIAQVNGTAMGGGLGLIAVCDAVIAQEKASFAFSEVRLGLIPAVISPYLLKKIGFSHSRRLMISGENFSTALAKEIHLIHEVCSLEELDSRAEALARKFLNNGPEAMAHIKRLLNRLDEVSEKVMVETARAIAEQRVGVEGQEGIQALLEKRKPSFFVKEV